MRKLSILLIAILLAIVLQSTTVEAVHKPIKLLVGRSTEIFESDIPGAAVLEPNQTPASTNPAVATGAWNSANGSVVIKCLSKGMATITVEYRDASAFLLTHDFPVTCNNPSDRVPAGFDLFETDSATTSFSFEQEFTIPPEFFDPGSQPFHGTVQFRGVPIGTFNGEFAGTADTVVRRPTDALLPSVGSDTIPIELVSLSLTSVSPITVTFQDGSTQLWNLDANASPSKPSNGSITIRLTVPNGGTFDSQLTVYPLLTFTRQNPPATRIIDIGSLQLPPESVDKITLRAFNVPWTHTCPPPVLQNPRLNPEFCASATPDGKVLSREEALLAKHGILPANTQPKPVGGYAFSLDGFGVIAPYILIAGAIVAITAGLLYARRIGIGRYILPRRQR